MEGEAKERNSGWEKFNDSIKRARIYKKRKIKRKKIR